MGRPVRRVGLPQVPHREPRPEPASGSASTTSTSSTRIGSTRTRRSRRPSARSTRSVRQGKAIYVGISSYSAADTRRAQEIARSLGHADRHPPAVVLDARPLDRARPPRRGRRHRDGVHRLLPARAGTADRPLPRRDPRRLRALRRTTHSRRHESPTSFGSTAARACRDRGRAGSDARSARACVDAARRHG